MVRKKVETDYQALMRMFKEIGAKVVTVKLTKAQQREWDKRDKDTEAFLKAKYKSQKESEKCKMIFKSDTPIGQTHVRTKSGAVVPLANPTSTSGPINFCKKNGKPVKLPKNWGKVNV